MSWYSDICQYCPYVHFAEDCQDAKESGDCLKYYEEAEED